MAQMTHIMVDTETTGTDPQTAAIIQLAGIKFNLETMEIGSVFDRCPARLPRRSWDEGTRAFWRGHKAIYDGLIARQEPAAPVFQAFADWVCEDAPQGGYIFVAKPLKFDWPMVESHMVDLGIPFPFPHWQCMDMHSYVAGAMGAFGRTNVEELVPFPENGLKHNALHDCAYQMDLMLYPRKHFAVMETLDS